MVGGLADAARAALLRQGLRSFEVRSSRIEVLDSPAAFYADLLARCGAARARVSLSALYWGTGEREAARSVLDWHARHRFCARCGAETQPFRAGWGRRCPACGTEHFPRVDPVVIMMTSLRAASIIVAVVNPAGTNPFAARARRRRQLWLFDVDLSRLRFTMAALVALVRRPSKHDRLRSPWLKLQ